MMTLTDQQKKHAIVMKLSKLPSTGVAQPSSEVSYLEDWHQLDGLERAVSFGVLAHLPSANVQTVLSRMEELEVVQGDVIFEQGAIADYFYIVKSGTAEVCREGDNQTSVRLTVKVSGDSFGDEGLVTKAPRSATLRMLTAGQLLRITGEDFAAYIHQPLRSPVTLQAAQDLVAQGACWLDLREPEVFARASLPGALNIPAILLRNKRNVLDAAQTYVIYSDDLNASELGCYLLAERGLKAYFVAELIPYFAARAHTTPVIPAPVSVPAQALATVAANASAEAHTRLPEIPTLLIRQLIEAERKRYERLLAQRTVELREVAERQMNEKIAATDRALREQVRTKLLQLKGQQEALLEEARKLQTRAAALDAQAAALAAQQRALDEVRAASG